MHSFRGTCFRLTGRRWFIRSFHHIEADVYCIWDFHCLVSLAYAADKNYKHMIHGHVVLSEFLHKTKNTITNANKKIIIFYCSFMVELNGQRWNESFHQLLGTLCGKGPPQPLSRCCVRVYFSCLFFSSSSKHGLTVSLEIWKILPAVAHIVYSRDTYIFATFQLIQWMELGNVFENNVLPCDKTNDTVPAW